VRTTAILGVVLCVAAAPLAGQGTADLPLAIGMKVEAQRVGDDRWAEGRIVGVGDCLTVRFGDDASSSDGFITTGFRSVAGVRIGSTSQGWKVASADQLARLRACNIGGPSAAAPAPECGSDPSVARSTVLGFLYGLGMHGTENPIWGPYTALDQKEIVPVTIGPECARIVTALAAERAKQGAAADTLPLKGVLDLGGLGYVVSRGSGPTGPSQRLTISTALLSRALELKSYQHFTY
jgi:hypothetical protein